MLLTNGHIATLQSDNSFGLIGDGVIALDGAQIAWVGASSDLPDVYQNQTKHDLNGRLVTPALIDCHTHVVFGGNRAAEFEQRLNGASYEEVAKAGGGIVSTVTATRAATEDALLVDALTRVDAMIAEGVTLIEV
ncbi:MAG: imidazolonepropionase, partial [Octadecabacter sp.]|nr:imidazolonepropionase [Octadecabacter sp.]